MITQRYAAERDLEIYRQAYPHMVLCSRDEDELNGRSSKQIRMSPSGDVEGLVVGNAYEERVPPKKYNGVILVHPDKAIRRFKLLGKPRDTSRLPNPNRWISVLVQGQQDPIDVSLADLGIVPYCDHPKWGKDFRFNHYVVPL